MWKWKTNQTNKSGQDSRKKMSWSESFKEERGRVSNKINLTEISMNVKQGHVHVGNIHFRYDCFCDLEHEQRQRSDHKATKQIDTQYKATQLSRYKTFLVRTPAPIKQTRELNISIY